MKQGYSKPLKFVSMLLLLAMLITSQTFTVLASEIAIEVFSNDDTALKETLDDETILPTEETDATETVTPELLALLERSNEYDSFTEEEKRMFQEFFHMAVDEEEHQKALEAQAHIQREIDAMPEKMRYESYVLGYADEGKTYSTLTEDERSVVLGYSELPKTAAQAFALFEEQGLDLFDSMVAVEIMIGDLFTAEESLILFNMYNDRSDLEKNILGFKNFAKAFVGEAKVLPVAEYTPESIAAARAEIIAKKAKYVSAEALEEAKQMLLDGHTLKEIRAAYVVAATYDLDPIDLLIKVAETPMVLSTSAEQSFFNVYPVNPSVLNTELLDIQTEMYATSMAADKEVITTIVAEGEIDYSSVAAEVASTGAILYSSLDEVEEEPVEDVIEQPFDIGLNERENVSLNTGALHYTETLVDIPSVNGSSVELCVEYNSSDSSLEKYSYSTSTRTRYAVIGYCAEALTVRTKEICYLDTADYVEIKGFSSAEAANEKIIELEESKNSCTLTNPYTDSREAEVTVTNRCTKKWYTNPYELVEETQSNPAPSSYNYNKNGYSGLLPRTDTQKTYDNGTITLSTTEDGRELKYQETEWVATYSGKVYKTITKGYYKYIDLQTVSYSSTSYSNNTIEQTYNEKRYDIGSGWSFNIPSIDTNSKSRSLILPGKGTYALSGNTIKEYPLKDMVLTSDSSYNNGQFDSSKKLTFADGTVYYFNSNGLLLADVDRFGNTITYKYAEVDGEYHLSEIIDTVGRSITITYETVDTGKIVTITAPDGSSTVLHTKALDSATYGEDNSVLEKIVYPDGETVFFNYEIEEGTYNFKSTSGGSTIQYALLNKVSYDTGVELHYAYELKDTKLGSGHLNVYRITDRYTLDTFDDNRVVDKTNYSYTSDYSRKTEYKTKVTEISTIGEISTEYTFNKDHLCTNQILYDGDTEKQQVVTTYHSTYDLPIKVVTTVYGQSGNEMKTTELYTYDKFGNVLTYISPKAEGDEESTEYLTVNEYSIGQSSSTYTGYNLPLTVSYKQDANTTVLIEYGLINNDKSIGTVTTSVNGDIVAEIEYTYDDYGRVVSEKAYHNLDTESNNAVVTIYNYDNDETSESYGTLTSVTAKDVVDNNGNTTDITTSYTYDAMGRLLTVTDSNGNVTATEYDDRDRTTKVTNPDGSYTEYIYDTVNNITTVNHSMLDAVTYDYDSIGHIETTRYVDGTVVSECFYDESGRLIAEAANRSSSAATTTYYTYDAFERITEKNVYDVNNTLVYRETYEYNDVYTSMLSLVIKTVHGDQNAADIITKAYTNKYGETVKEDVGGVVTEYAYDYVGNAIHVFYDDTTLASYTYDYAGNVLSETNALGDTRTIIYDATGRKISESDYKGNVTSYTYDNAGRLLIMTMPFTDTTDSVIKYYYDANGNVVKQQQTAHADNTEETVWRTVESTYDCMNRVTDIVNYVDDTTAQYTHYVYDDAGNLTDVYTGLAQLWTYALSEDSYSHIKYTYDGRGNNTSLTDALGQNETYQYDVLGTLTTSTLRDGTVYDYTYNPFGNVTDIVTVNGKVVSERSTAYTETGTVCSVTLDGVTVSYTYDGLGNVLTETEGDVVKTYTYDTRGRKSSYTLTVDGEEKSSAIYSYDNMNRLTSVAEGGLTTTYTYDANGNRTSQTTGEVTTEYTYNKANLVTDMTNTMVNAEGDSVVISSFAYTYYTDGNMHTKSETLLDTTTNTEYVYDGAGRLVSETTGDKVISYYYDANNNRTLMNNDSVITSYTYDKNNRLLTEGDTAYTYDANGNTLTAGNKTYIYNARGQQIGYSDGETSAQYAYNPSGLRSAKTVGGSTKYFVYNGMNIVFEYEDSISDGTIYYYGLNRTHNSNGEIYVYNAHGDTVQLVKNNAVVVSYTYDAFGNLTSQIGESDNPFLYCSEYFNSETQTYYLRARYYNPANGRFNAEDPHWDASNRIYGDDPFKIYEYEDALELSKYTLLPSISVIMQSGNLYVYCANNPVKYIDSSGSSIVLACVIVGAVLGATIGGVYGARKAQQAGYTIDDGWKYLKYVVGYGAGGATAGALVGWGVGSAITAIGTAMTAGSCGTLGTIIYENWQKAEQFVRDSINSVSAYAERVFNTPFGNRVADAYNNSTRVIAEAKYGYVSLTEFVQQQINKDAYLLQQGTVSKVEWHFFVSQVTGQGGPSAPLLEELTKNGFSVIFH